MGVCAVASRGEYAAASDTNMSRRVIDVRFTPHGLSKLRTGERGFLDELLITTPVMEMTNKLGLRVW
jgi:hypothetical protein